MHARKLPPSPKGIFSLLQAYVTFRFDYSVGRGIDRYIVERSRFVKEDGRWLFINTDVLEPKNLAEEASPLSPLTDLDV